MKRVLFDTSVYGRLTENTEIIEILIKRIPKDSIIYGNEVIRKELRDTPKHVKHEGRNLRILLLNIYRNLTRDHELKLNKLIEMLSSDYFKEYTKQGGVRSDKKMENDLILIATATIYSLDIVVSDDEKTMLSPDAIKAYKTVNNRYGIENPDFILYKKFKEWIKNQEDFPV